MNDKVNTIALCSCEDTMRPDAAAVQKACAGVSVKTARHLCRSEAGMLAEWAAKPGGLLIGCTQEAPLFQDLAEENGFSASLSFANIREAAGWSTEGAKAGPKMAALLAAAQVATKDAGAVTLSSEGVALILGRGQEALDLATKLAARLDVTLVLSSFDGVMPPRSAEFPIRRGRARQATGWLGAFEVTIDGYAEPAPSSRGEWRFASVRDGLTSRCDILIDLTGGQPLFPAHDLRSGYLRADPGSPTAIAELAFQAADLVGSFDKPRYIDFKADLCAHSRSRITGCTRCLDLCPTGAITPGGDAVAISAEICAGCGACAAACPTGAANYALPGPDVLLARLRALLQAYRTAGGKEATVLFHDGTHGWSLIEALARYGDGLPAHVLPVEVNETTQVGIEAIAAIFAYGGSAVRFLTRARPKHDIDGLRRTIALANRLVGSQGYGGIPAATIETDDPDELLAQLRAVAPGRPTAAPSAFLPAGGKREVMTLALREMHRVAPEASPVVALEAGAPSAGSRCGRRAARSASPASPLPGAGARRQSRQADADLRREPLRAVRPLRRHLPREGHHAGAPRQFRGLRRQAGRAEAGGACPLPRLRQGFRRQVHDRPDRRQAGGQALDVRRQNAERLRVLRLCEDCRVGAMAAQSFDPYGVPERAPAKTTEDYLREREGKGEA